MKLSVEEGDRYGHWTVLKEVERLSVGKMIYRQFLLKCTCGTQEIKKLSNMKDYKDSASCGCKNTGRGIRDLTGQRFNSFTAIEITDDPPEGGSLIWKVSCDCGNVLNISSRNLTAGMRKHCGCIPMGTHKMTGSPTHISWGKMLSRIRSKSPEYIEWYHDVSVCDRWDTRKGGSFENFLEDMGERPEGKTLNRIHGAKVYSKETCEWSDLSNQSFDQKRKKHNQTGRTGVVWREERQVWSSSISKDNITHQLYYGTSYEDACKAREEAEIKFYGYTKE